MSKEFDTCAEHHSSGGAEACPLTYAANIQGYIEKLENINQSVKPLK